MPVNSSPRLRDSLDYEEPDATDPRLAWGFSSLSLEYSDGYEQYEPEDHRSIASNPEPSSSRRRRRQRLSDLAVEQAAPFRFDVRADGDTFRLCVLRPGTGTAPVECRLLLKSTKYPPKDYLCLSYCWETTERHAAILLDGYRFPVTKNLLSALQNLRNSTTDMLIWVDQISINQSDVQERGHQVAMMKKIFDQSSMVLVWLGDSDHKSERLCEYARQMRRSDSGNQSSTLNRILSPRQLQDALQKLLQRPWFQRVWVIPEVALARFTTVAIGKSRLSWDNLVRLVRDVPLPQTSDSEKMRFDKQTDLLGNPRQRIAIITQMSASQRKGLLHTDITQLLILAKASQATDVRDMVYAFYGITLLTTFPDYAVNVEHLFADIAHMYVNSILYDDYYSKWHGLNASQRTQQLMSILYSAGSLHQHYYLPSWVPDLTYAWHLAPIWSKTTSNIVTASSGRDEWTSGVRTDYRAGGDRIETFEVLDRIRGVYHLRLSALIIDSIQSLSATTPASTPAVNDKPIDSPHNADDDIPHTLTYGRIFFETVKGFMGVATEGVAAGDCVAILAGGDIPVVLRRNAVQGRTYRLLCECYIKSQDIMGGDAFATQWPMAEDVILI